MTITDSDDYGNPYGDLEFDRPQYHDSTSSCNDGAEGSGNDDESRGLIKTSGGEQESELAMAVEDLLSSCNRKVNPTQFKLLRDMENRYQEKGSLITGEEGELEKFHDEESVDSQKASPIKQWFRRQPEVKKNEYVTRSSRFIVELPVIEEDAFPRKAREAWKYVYCLSMVILVILFIVIMWLLKLTGWDLSTEHGSSFGAIKPSDSAVSYFTSDCTMASKQRHPSPLTQCACGGKIHAVSDKAKEKYDTLLYAFGAEYLHESETMSSCSARNQALVWLAEDPGSTLSEVLIQRHSLVLFFIKLHGIDWTLEDHQKWLTPSHECTWFGVVCGADKEVTAIELWNLGLKGSIPKEIMSLTMLERLSLPENNISGKLPADAFEMMSKLTDLTLFMNNLSGAIDARIFDSITRLKTLNLDSNGITGFIPSQIGQLSQLTQLKLARNYLNGPLPSQLGNLKLMKRMEIEENNIYGTIPTEMGELSLLESLNLSWNNLQGPIPHEFQSFRNLKDLFLKSNDLGGTLPSIINVMGKLENLVLSLNALSGNLPSEMNLMSSLSTLHLDENKFDGTIPEELGSCQFLRDARLNHNRFTGPIPSHLGRLAWLISFNIEGNSFTGSMPKEVCNLRGEVGTLETLTATCTADTEAIRQKTVFGNVKEFICEVPQCCTFCAPAR